jgi:hypothetical protein
MLGGRRVRRLHARSPLGRTGGNADGRRGPGGYYFRSGGGPWRYCCGNKPVAGHHRSACCSGRIFDRHRVGNTGDNRAGGRIARPVVRSDNGGWQCGGRRAVAGGDGARAAGVHGAPRHGRDTAVRGRAAFRTECSGARNRDLALARYRNNRARDRCRQRNGGRGR